jgi:hypothetical protein
LYVALVVAASVARHGCNAAAAAVLVAAVELYRGAAAVDEAHCSYMALAVAAAVACHGWEDAAAAVLVASVELH